MSGRNEENGKGSNNLIRMGRKALIVAPAAGVGGAAGGIGGAGLGAAVGGLVGGPAGAAVGYGIGLTACWIAGTFGAGYAANELEKRICTG